MKTIAAFIALFLFTFLHNAEAQSGKSYEEWRRESRAGSKASAKKTSTKAKTTPAKAAKETPVAAAAMAAPSGTFRGILDCSDCKGIRTELILNGSPKDPNRNFTMRQMYVGKSDDKSVIAGSGKWILAKGNKQDPDAVILQLIPMDGDLELMYFLQVSETEVRLLNNRQEEINDSKNYSLRKL